MKYATMKMAVALAFAANSALAGVEDVDNRADISHPNIHDNVGGGSDGPRKNANPTGANERGGGLHGIANNPGQSGSKPNDDGTNGQANELETMHGGIGGVNKNAD